MPMITVDAATARSLEFAANMAGVPVGVLIARMVQERSERVVENDAGGVAVFAVYEGKRTLGEFDPSTSRLDITDGPLSGQSFKSPTGAARAVVGHYKPEVSPHRNGWSFWMLNDGTRRLLQDIRPD